MPSAHKKNLSTNQLEPLGNYWFNSNKTDFYLELSLPQDYRDNKFVDSPNPDDFVNLNEDLYQMHKLDDFNIEYCLKFGGEENELPDMSVLLLIDGSGSMYGERRNSAMISSVILHEVLKKQGIVHAIVEHRGHFHDPEIDVNILVDFNSKEEEKLNIMQLDSAVDNRDGFALYWAEKYINQKTFCDNKLIIVLSDGQPSHEYDEYYGPVANKDTANAAKKIINRGTNIIAVALDDECFDDEEYSTYCDLQEIYPHLIQCKDLKRLTGQILNIVSKQMM